MPAPTLSQLEADYLIALEKHCLSDKVHELPHHGQSLIIPLKAPEVPKENFHLDLHRGRIRLYKGKFQSRVRTNLVLARVDIGGRPHTNPDGQKIPCPHIHVYKEGYGAAWAYPLTTPDFPDSSDHWEVLNHFFRYCRITRPPLFEKGLFV